MIRNNLFYKLLSVAVALALWAYVNAERNPQSQKVVTVNLMRDASKDISNLARGYTWDTQTRQVKVTVSGAKAIVDGIGDENVNAWVDLSGFRAGTSANAEVKTRVAGLSADQENSLTVSAEPKVIKVRVDALTEKRLPVEVKFLSAAPLGYAYSDPELDPASVRVAGKIIEVARVRRVMLELSGQMPNGPIDDSFDLKAVDAKGNQVEGVTLDPASAQLRLQLVEVPATKTVLVSPGVVGTPKFPSTVVKITSLPPSVVLDGKPTDLSSISTVSTEKISIDGLDKTITRDVLLRLPPRVGVVGRSRVRIIIEIGAPRPTSDGPGL